MKVTILNDNRSSASCFACEHGLSVLVQWDNGSLLLDTGQTDKFLRNAETLGISLTDVDACVVSHGHYDHSGGMQFLNRSIPIYIGKDASRVRYSLSSVMKKPNGMPRPEILSEFNLHVVDGVMRLSDEVTLFSLPTDAPANERLVVDGPDGSLVPDLFSDELFTLIHTGETTLLFGGCTHHGLSQLLTFVRDSLAISHIDVFVGGLHLSGRPIDIIEHEAHSATSILPVDRWLVGHCTGDDALQYWKQHLGAEDAFAGMQIEV